MTGDHSGRGGGTPNSVPADGRPLRAHRAVALLIVVSLVIGACSNGDADEATASPQATSAENAEDAATEQITSSGEETVAPIERMAPADAVVFASPVPPRSLDPHQSLSAYDLTYLSMIYDRLTELTNRLETVPMLATEWSTGDGGATVDMTLREGVVFEDGTPFDAAAVVANIERAKSFPDGAAGRTLGAVERVEEIDATHVRFHLTGVTTDLPTILAGPAGFMVSPRALAEGVDLQVAGAAAGTGPFHLKAWEPGTWVSYEPIQTYWDPERQRHAETYLAFQPSDAARLAGLQSGAYDVVGVKGDQVDEAIAVGEEQDFRSLTQYQNSVYGLLLNPSLPVLSSPEIRQAIMLAINHNDVVDGMMSGTCDARVQPFPLGSKYYYPEVERQYGYDPDRARQLVAASGVEDPTFDVYAAEGIYSLLAHRIQPHLAEVGITMNVIEADLATTSDAWTEGTASIYLVMPPSTDPNSLLFGTYLRRPWWEEAITAEAGADLAQLQELEANDPARTDLYRNLYTTINELALFVPGCSITSVWMWAPGIQGVDLMPYLWAGQVLPYTIDRTQG